MTEPIPIGPRLARFVAAALLGAIMALGGMVFISGSVAALERTKIKRMVIEEALNSRVPPSLALALAKVESDFMARALSPSGARGATESVRGGWGSSCCLFVWVTFAGLGRDAADSDSAQRGVGERRRRPGAWLADV